MFGGRFLRQCVFAMPIVFVSAWFSHSAFAATFTVNSTLDINDGTCVHPYVDAANDCTWREAINAANTAAGADTINFDINAAFPNDGDGQWTIPLGGATNPLTGQTTVTAVDRWDVDDNRPGIKFKRTTTADTFVTLTGSGANSKVQGLEFEGGASAISVGVAGVTIGTDCDGQTDERERNVIHAAAADGILITNVGSTKVRGNYIGVKSDGITPVGLGTYGIRITGASGDGNSIGYVEGSSGTCAAALQRNVIGGGDGAFDYGIYIASTSVTNTAGDAAQAPDGNRVSGNYIGIGADGVSDIGLLGSGVVIGNAATKNFVGTDGDGVDDSLEGNVIGGWSNAGVFVNVTGYNRISGNLVGFAADGVTNRGNTSHGVVIRGTGNIVGWCDASVDATLCANGGARATSQNVIGFNGGSGVRPGASCNACKVLGNSIGTDVSQSIDAGNGENGVFIHRGNANAQVGGPTENHGNVISYNRGDGIHIDGYFSGTPFAPGPTEGFVIQSNTITFNYVYGMHLLGTEQDGTLGSPDGTVHTNTISNNGAAGMVLEGSSPAVTANTIANNGTYGIFILSAYRHDEPTDTSANFANIYDTLAPQNSSYDSVSQPVLTQNAIDGNAGGGIYILDARPSNADTLVGDNTIGSNGGFDVRQDWYGAVELLQGGASLTSGNVQVTLVPANGKACTGVCTGSTYGATGDGNGTWGMPSTVYTNAATWFLLTDYTVNIDGERSDYNPYSVHIQGDYRRHGGGSASYTFDGASGDMSSGGLPAGLTTGGSVYRYQLAEMTVIRDSGDQTPPSTVRSPIARAAVAISDTAIRWFFSDTSSDEMGFRLYDIENGKERLITDSGISVAKDYEYLDETDLQAGTEYCNRVIEVFNGTNRARAELPCATTLSAGEENTEVPDSLPKEALLVLDEVITVMESGAAYCKENSLPIGGLVASALIMGSSLALGRTRRRRIRHGGDHTFAYIVLAAACCALIMQLVVLASSCSIGDLTKYAFADRQKIDGVLREGDQMTVAYTVANLGNADAESVSFAAAIVGGEVEGEVLLDGAANAFAESEGERLLELGTLAPQEQHTVSYSMKVTTTESLFTHKAELRAENAASANAYHAWKVVASGDARPGTLLRADGDATVYMIDIDGSRRPFTSEAVLTSWFDATVPVKKVSSEEIALYPMGNVMLPRPGSRLVRFADLEEVYAVEPGNVARPLNDEVWIQALFGKEWRDHVIALDVTAYSQFSVGEVLEYGAYPDGHMITDGERVCYLENNRCRELSKSGIRLNFVPWGNIYTVPSYRIDDLYQGKAIRGYEPAVTSDMR